MTGKQSASCEANSSSFSKQFLVPYGEQKIINGFDGVRHWYPFWAGLIYSTPSHIFSPHIIAPSSSHLRLKVGSGKEWTDPPHTELPAICVCPCISTRSRVRERTDRPSPHGATCHLCVCLHFHSQSGLGKYGQALPTRSYLLSVCLCISASFGCGNACTTYVW